MVSVIAGHIARHRSRVLAAPVVVAIAIGAWLRVDGAMHVGEVADVATFHLHVDVLRSGGSVYRQSWSYPYFAGWLAIEWLSWLLANFLRVPFWIVIRLVVVGADVLTCFVLWWTATILHGRARGRWAAALYALSPIAIIVSGYHGQFDALATLVAMLATGLVARGTRSEIVGVLLGLAIAIKPQPTVLVPVFLRAYRIRSRQSLAVVALFVVVLGAAVVFLSGTDLRQVLLNVLTYRSGNDQGLGGLLRSIWLARAHNLSLPGSFGFDLTMATRWLAIALMGLTWLLTWRYSVARSSAAIMLAFLAVFGAISTQYLLWPMAWLLLSEIPLGWSVFYAFGVSFGAIGYYEVYWPSIILIHSGRVIPEHVNLYIGGEILSWLTILAVFFAAVGKPRGAGRWWSPAVAGAGVLVAVTAWPVTTLLITFVKEWIKFRT